MGDDSNQIDEEFERVWNTADWVFKNDKQDARYFWLKGRHYELNQQQIEIDRLLQKVTS